MLLIKKHACFWGGDFDDIGFANEKGKVFWTSVVVIGYERSRSHLSDVYQSSSEYKFIEYRFVKDYKNFEKKLATLSTDNIGRNVLFFRELTSEWNNFVLENKFFTCGFARSF